ncbi:fungal-specific transcription factor domain-containing protein [Crassisporium funariophilum]|nr:fungal-specific transcription factor domain-containing protein [Crassisporium funariophilum]
MPVDTTKVVSSRRTTKKLTEEEIKDIQQKRLRGELACAECRRLKLRCDKNLPCGSCYRRGCESICPLGILAGGQGTRFILADTEQLHDKIYEMSNRIRQLEDALAILQSSVSDRRHSLLTDELLKIKFGSESINAREAESAAEEDTTTQRSIDALGTLTLGSSGEIQYLGRSAGSEKADDEGEDYSDDDPDDPPVSMDRFVEVEKLADLFPFTSKNRSKRRGLELLETFLPSYTRALKLCDSYINHAAYFFRPIKRDELLGVLLPAIYAAAEERKKTNFEDVPSPRSDFEDPNTNENLGSGSPGIPKTTPHALASLYFIFALGALLDLELAPYNSEAERYYDLGRAGLSLRAVYDSANMDSVQAMGLMATYHSLGGKKYSRDSAWCVMSFAAKLAQSVAIDRDSARWNMDPDTVQRRRNLFWEVFSADVSHSLALGRPPAIHLSYVDCEYPEDDDASLSDDAGPHTGFWRMKHTFGRDIYNSVADATLIARAPSYNTVLDLDKKVREVSFPASFNPYISREAGEEIFHSSSLSLRDFYASQNRTVTMLYLHRSFFAQAMLDHPTNPLLSTFAPSFLTAYRCASVIIKASAHLFERCAAMAMRLWFLMYHTFSAAVIVGTVVTRSPNSNIASIAMRDFNHAVGLFERTAAQSQRAKVALGVLMKLKEKAIRVYTQHNNPPPTSPSVPSPGSSTETNPDDIEDDLAIFGGQMRVLDRKGKQPPKHQTYQHQRSSTSPVGAVRPTLQPGEFDIRPLSLSHIKDVGVRIESRDENYSHEPRSRQDVDANAWQNGGVGGIPISSSAYPAATYSEASMPSEYIPRLPLNPNQEQAFHPTGESMRWGSVTGEGQINGYLPNGGDNYGLWPADVNPGRSMGLQTNPESVYHAPLPRYMYDTRAFSAVTNPTQVMDPAGAVELGLSSESGMDAGWLSFMRDCGIMDTESG